MQVRREVAQARQIDLVRVQYLAQQRLHLEHHRHDVTALPRGEV